MGYASTASNADLSDKRLTCWLRWAGAGIGCAVCGTGGGAAHFSGLALG